CLADDAACAVQQFYNGLALRLQDRLRDLGLLRQRLRQVHDLLVCPPGMEPVLADGTPEAGDAGLSDAPGHDPCSLSPTPMASLTSFWELSRTSPTARVVLPEGETDLDRAASRFVATLTADHWAFLDQTLQEEVLAPRGGLAQAAFASNDLHRALIGPL